MINVRHFVRVLTGMAFKEVCEENSCAHKEAREKISRNGEYKSLEEISDLIDKAEWFNANLRRRNKRSR